MQKLWEDDIFGKVRKEDWLAIGNVSPTRPNDVVDSLLGDDKTDNILAKWESIASEYQTPVAAEFHALDTEAKTTFRVPIDAHSIEKGLIKVKINQSERLRTLARSGVQGSQELYNYVMDDGIRLADQVIIRSKMAKNELLATGQVTIHENNLDLTIPYGVTEAQKGFILDFSASAQTDIPTQLQNIVDTAKSKGVSLNGMLLSSRMLTKLRSNKEIQKLINGIYGEGAMVRKSALTAFLNDEYDIANVAVTDNIYNSFKGFDENGRPEVEAHRLYPNDKITFFAGNPAGKLGIGLWGDSPEVDAANFYKVGTSAVNPYVYIMQWMEADPAVLWTKASGLFMPVLYNPASLYIATEAKADAV